MKINGIEIKQPKNLKLNHLQEKSLKGFFNAYGESFAKKSVLSIDIDTRMNWIGRRGNVSGLTAIDNGLLFRPSLPPGTPDTPIKRLDLIAHAAMIQNKIAKSISDAEAQAAERQKENAKNLDVRNSQLSDMKKRFVDLREKSNSGGGVKIKAMVNKAVSKKKTK